MVGRTAWEHDEYLNSQPFFGKIKVGDLVHGKIVHNYQVPHEPKPEYIGLCIKVTGDGHLIHVQDLAYIDDIRIIGIENVISVSPMVDDEEKNDIKEERERI
jgi:hypothetical protein